MNQNPRYPRIFTAADAAANGIIVFPNGPRLSPAERSIRAVFRYALAYPVAIAAFAVGLAAAVAVDSYRNGKAVSR